HIETGTFFDKFYDEKVERSHSSGKTLTNADIEKVESFEELGLSDILSANITKAGYTEPTTIQKYAINNIMKGKDLMACSQTGSGKTASFLLPIISYLMREQDLSSVSDGICYPRALILLPTRELAMQIHREAIKFSSGSSIKCEALYGGTSVEYQKARIMEGANILVGTVGRVRQFVEEKIINLEKIEYFVLDEADRMLSDQFSEDVNAIMKEGKISKKNNRQTLLFSCRLWSSLEELAKDVLLKDDYLMIVIDFIGADNKRISQDFVEVNKDTKRQALLDILGVQIEKCTHNEDFGIFKKKTLIFVSNKKMADELVDFLSKGGIPAGCIHGGFEQDEREFALNEFRNGRTQILIATGIAERGLDITGVVHVINYEMPKEIFEYVHRIGRTGRVGNPGHATSLIYTKWDRKIIGPLISLLSEAEQPVPDWLKKVRAVTWEPVSVVGSAAAYGGWKGEEESGW
ncbi:hypothetical protein PMAYCL1PPCAC_25464, partial [Pristionchus mayeri]